MSTPTLTARFRRAGRASTSQAFAHAVIRASHNPLLLMDEELRILAASRSFYSTFGGEAIEGRTSHELSLAGWGGGSLVALVRQALAGEGPVPLELEISCTLGRRSVRLAANLVVQDGRRRAVLLSIEDLTNTLLETVAKDGMLRDAATALQEVRHRVANNLMIICGLIRCTMRRVQSEEARQELENVRLRITTMGAIESHLMNSSADGSTPVGPYFEMLCKSLAGSMISPEQGIQLTVKSGKGSLPREVLVRMGLIVTELVINALKHAFAPGQPGHIAVEYAATERRWMLSVTDDGVGLAPRAPADAGGLGSGLVRMLAEQLNADLRVIEGSAGFGVELCGGTFS